MELVDKSSRKNKGFKQAENGFKIKNTKKTNRYANIKSGWYDINGKKMYFRSRWEANYALYLDFLKKHKIIKMWEYEPDTFWFEKIKRGTRSYLPDFKITQEDGNIVYHEVKGYVDSKTKTKLKRMTKYYPKIKLLLITNKIYKNSINKIKGIVKLF